MKYGKFWNVSLEDLKVEQKPPFSEECSSISSIHFKIYFEEKKGEILWCLPTLYPVFFPVNIH